MARQHDDNIHAETYWINGEMLRELGIHLTLGHGGVVLAIKHSKSRGVSTDLYKWKGDMPQDPDNPGRRSVH